MKSHIDCGDCPSEHIEQIRLVAWFERTYTKTSGVRILAIPNGSLRNKLVAIKLKQEGVRAGVPDLFVPAWHLWIEMKRRKGGTLRDVQKDWRDYLTGIGQHWILCRGFDEAKMLIQDFVQKIVQKEKRCYCSTDDKTTNGNC